MKNFISLNIKHLRDVNKFSRDEFGALFELKTGVIGTYERDTTNPQIPTIQKICAHFEITIDDFINKDLSKIKPPIDIENEMMKQMEVMEPGSFYGSAFIVETLQKQLSDKDTIIDLMRGQIQTLKGQSADGKSKTG